MGRRGKSKAFGWLVAFSEFLKNPVTGLPGALTAAELYAEQEEHAGKTDELLGEFRALREELEQTGDDEISSWLEGLANLSGLGAQDLRKIVARWAKRLGLVGDEERLREYRERAALKYMCAEFRGIAQMTTIVTMPLDEVFVPLSAAPEAVTREATEKERGLIEELARAEDAGARAEVERRLSEIGARGFLRAGGERAAPMVKVVREHRKVVVLGDPGSGKTTFVSWLARQCAAGPQVMGEKLGWGEDLVPVVVPIAAYGAALEKEDRLRLHEHMGRELDRDGDEGFGDLMLQRAKEGGCLILLDGLDEIPDPRLRLLAARGVGDLMVGHPDCRYVVTSRIVGYEACRVSGEVSHYVLRGFEDDEIRLFARQWCEAYERASRKEAADLDRARREAEELAEAIFDRAHPQVVEFARNPLLLTILALVKQRRVQLPERRVELYDIALKTLMERWVRGRGMAGPVRGVELDVGQSLRVWQRVAYWMHAEMAAGTARQSQLLERLKEALVEEEGLSEKEAVETAESFLRAAAEQTGLLRERGADTFGFLHQAFEEYLAARHVARPPHSAFARVASHLHDPRWREVVLLTAGYVGQVLGQPEYAGEFVDSIRRARSAHEDILHRDLLLAAECLAERTPVDRRCAEGVLGGLCEVAGDGSGWEVARRTGHALTRLERVRPCAVDLTRVLSLMGAEEGIVRLGALTVAAQDDSARVTEALRDALSDLEAEVRGFAGVALVAREAVDGGALGVVVDGVESEWGDWILRWLRRASAHAGKRDLLTGRLQAWVRQGDVGCRVGAAFLMRELGGDQGETVRRLVEEAGSRDARGQAGALATLAALGARLPEVADAVIAGLGSKAAMVRQVALAGVELLEVSGARVVAGALRCLRDDDAGVRAEAARLVGSIGMAWDGGTDGLAALMDDPDEKVRKGAAAALGGHRAGGGEAAGALRKGLEDEGAQVLVRSVEGLLRLGSVTGEEVQVLLVRARDKDALIRSAARICLGVVPAGPELAERIMHELANGLDDPDEFVRYNTVQAVGRRGVRGEGVIAHLAPQLENKSPGVLAATLVALGRLGPLPEAVVERMRELLGHEDADVRYWAARSLVVEEERGRA